MANKIVGQCPVCGSNMKVTELQCSSCNTKVSGRFDLGHFSQLTPDQLKFVEIFIRLRGNIKEVEEEMGISYKVLDRYILTGAAPPAAKEKIKSMEKKNKHKLEPIPMPARNLLKK